MRSSALRHVVRLRLTLVGPLPDIWREVVVDRDLSLADLRSVIQAVFEGQTCDHHLFTDNLGSHTWSRTRRRWGDRWTMIDFRDPTVIEEASVRIGRVLREAGTLYYGHTCEEGWLVEIEAREDDLAAAAAAPVQVDGGERRAPLPCCRSPYEHAVLVGVLEDTGHPEHDALVRRLDRTLGPWAPFDPEEFDITDAQRRIDVLGLGAAPAPRRQSGTPHGRLDWLVARLPQPARPGFERYLAASGIDLPTVVTTDEARAATREFAWVVTRAAAGGIAVADGRAEPSVVRAGIEALGCHEERMQQLIAFAKRGRLLYLRNGRLVANKRSAAAAADPSRMWSLLAEDLVRAVAPSQSGDLFLLAIADGSLADPAVGARRSAAALGLVRDRHQYQVWDYDYRSERSRGCEQACDCPSGETGTWHDIVARAIRDATDDAAGDEGVPVAAHYGHDATDDLGFASEWFSDTGVGRSAVATRTGVDAPVDEGMLLGEVGDLIELLSLFGLERTDGGTWIVPPILRELARDSLRYASNIGPF